MKTPPSKKSLFIRQLAHFLVAEQGLKSVKLQMADKSALEWQALRSATPLFGYPTVDEAEKILKEFLQ